MKKRKPTPPEPKSIIWRFRYVILIDYILFILVFIVINKFSNEFLPKWIDVIVGIILPVYIIYKYKLF